MWGAFLFVLRLVFFLFFCLLPGKNITYCFTVIARLTPSIHICVRRSIQLCRGRLILFLYCARFPLTGQISDRRGRLSYTALTYTLHGGRGGGGGGGGVWTAELSEPWHFFLWRISSTGSVSLPSSRLWSAERERGKHRGGGSREQDVSFQDTDHTSPPTAPRWPLFL